MPWTVVVGYFFSVVIGHLAVRHIVGALWVERGIRKKVWGWTEPMLVGILERFLYTASFQSGHAAFIAVWLGLKAVPQWKRWVEKTTYIQGRKIEGRSIYNIFLIGNAVSLVYGVAGAKLIEWLGNGEVPLAILVSFGLPIGSLFLFSFIKRQGAAARKEEASNSQTGDCAPS